MAGKITLAVTRGPLCGKSWTFETHDTCLVGRHAECVLQLPDDAAHKTVSRHHALLELNAQAEPPSARIRDFGSLNGTFVNGEKIGARAKDQTPAEGAKAAYPERELRDGDEIRVGDTVLRVAIEAPPKSTSGAAPPVVQNTPDGGVSDLIQQLLDEAAVQAPPAPLPDTPSRDRPPDAATPDAAKGGAKLPRVRGYEIVKELGRGGMGVVYLARHRQSGEQVALKVMLPRVAVEPRAQAQFLREVEITRALRHPNVVQMLDIGQYKNAYFFTLEFCEEGSVWDYYIERRGELPTIAESFSIALQVLEGLDYLGQMTLDVTLPDGSTRTVQGIVHRDLSPQNILLTKRGASGDAMLAKISDVGLGKAFETAGLSGMTMTGDAAGKPIFMPRQQLINYKFARPEVDLWAAAATLYFLLTGDFPRDFSDDADPWKTVLSTDPVPIRERIPKCPKPIAEVIDRALRDRPQLHYKRAADLQRDLLGALKSAGLIG